jgi:glycosyltransferase involved in cell wall biosynthesis
MTGADMKPTRIEVVVPSYNHGRYIDACLRSIFAQTAPIARLLVIDDGSSDDSVTRIEETLKDCPFPSELVARENRGLCATLQQGLEQTSGELFTYIGSDDQWVPNRLEVGARLLAENPGAVLSYSNFFLIDENGELSGNSADWPEYQGGTSLQKLILGHSIPQSTTVTYRRSAVEAFGWDESLRLEDYALFLRLANVGPFAFTPEPLGFWRHHPRNTSKDLEMMLAEVFRAHSSLAGELGLNARDLAAARGAFHFRYSDYVLRRGERLNAAKLAFGSLLYAPSPGAALRLLVRLATPQKLLKLREAVLGRNSRARHGGLA